MTVEKLDLIDKRIISELDKNARINYSQLGKKIKVAKETIKYRIKQLEKNGTIKGYYTVIDFSKLGFIVNRICIRIQTSLEKEKEMNEYLLNSKKIAVFYRVNGQYHIILGIRAKNIWECEKFWNDFKERFGDYITIVNSSIFTKYTEFSRIYLLEDKGEKKEFITLSESKPEKIDEIDEKIILFLSNNARAPLIEIAKNTKTSIMTVREHLKKLINNKIITGFRIIIDLRKIGMEYYKVDLWIKRMEKLGEISRHILSHPNVIYTEKSIITSDLEFDIEVENFEKFIEIMDYFKKKFPEDIKDYKYYSLIKNYKMIYAPSI